MATTTPPPDDTQRPAWTGPAADPSPVVQWIGWHLGELAGVTAPLVLAVTVATWWAVFAVLVAGAWTANEIRLCRRRRELAAARDQRTVTAGGRDPQDKPQTETETEASSA